MTYYAAGKLSNGSAGTIILRVLHEHMEPRHKVIRSLGLTKLRQRYSLEELTIGVTPVEAHASSADVDWGPDAGREIADE